MTHNQGVPGSSPGGPTPMNKGFQGIETFFYFAIPTHFRHKAVLSPYYLPFYYATNKVQYLSVNSLLRGWITINNLHLLKTKQYEKLINYSNVIYV